MYILIQAQFFCLMREKHVTITTIITECNIGVFFTLVCVQDQCKNYIKTLQVSVDCNEINDFTHGNMM